MHKKSPYVKTVFINCPLSITTERDTKGLYRRALLPAEDPDYIGHFTGISDPFELPEDADLILHTGEQTVEESVETLVRFVLKYVA